MRSPFSLRCSERCDVLLLCTAVPSPSGLCACRRPGQCPAPPPPPVPGTRELRPSVVCWERRGTHPVGQRSGAKGKRQPSSGRLVAPPRDSGRDFLDRRVAVRVVFTYPRAARPPTLAGWKPPPAAGRQAPDSPPAQATPRQPPGRVSFDVRCAALSMSSGHPSIHPSARNTCPLGHVPRLLSAQLGAQAQRPISVASQKKKSALYTIAVAVYHHTLRRRPSDLASTSNGFYSE